MTVRFSTGLRNTLAGIGRELVSNGDFATDATGWTAVGAGCAITGGVDSIGSRDNVLRVTTAAGYASQSVQTLIGHLYKFSFKHFDPTAGNGYVYAGVAQGGSTLYNSGALNDATWAAGTYTVYFVATTTTTYISLGTVDTNPQYYDDISLIDMAGSIQKALHLCELDIYTGAQPTTADAAPTGTLLVTIKNGSSGITFGDAVDGVLSKTSGETLTGTCVASGTAGWFRMRTVNDLGTLNTTDVRIDGEIATTGGEISGLRSLSFVAGTTQTIVDINPEVSTL